MTQRATEFYGEQFAATESVRNHDDLFDATVLRVGPMAIHMVKGRGILLRRDDLTSELHDVARASHATALQQFDIVPKTWRWTGMNQFVDALPNALLKPLKTGTIEKVVLDYVAPDELPSKAEQNALDFLKPTAANMNIRFPDSVVYGRIDAQLMIGRRRSVSSIGLMLFPHMDTRMKKPQVDVGIRTLPWGEDPQPAHLLHDEIRLEARRREGHNLTHPVLRPWKIPE